MEPVHSSFFNWSTLINIYITHEKTTRSRPIQKWKNVRTFQIKEFLSRDFYSISNYSWNVDIILNLFCNPSYSLTANTWLNWNYRINFIYCFSRFIISLSIRWKLYCVSFSALCFSQFLMSVSFLLWKYIPKH